MNLLEKVLEEIENLNYHPEGMGCGIEDCGITDRYEACEYGWDKAIEAVLEAINNMNAGKDTDVPTNNGWIPCSERLPEDGTYLCTLDGELVGEEKPFTGMCGIENGKWDEDGCVIAWQPLPEPYKPEEPKQQKNTQQELEDFWRDK